MYYLKAFIYMNSTVLVYFPKHEMLTSQFSEAQQLATHSAIDCAVSSRVNVPASAAPRGTTPSLSPNSILCSSGDVHKSATILPTNHKEEYLIITARLIVQKEDKI